MTAPGPTATRGSLRSRLRGWVEASHGGWSGWWRGLLAQASYLAGGAATSTRPDLARVQRLVFVCVGNVNRSAFAEAVARRRGARAESFGLAAPQGIEVSPRALRTAARYEIDLRAHVARDLSDYEFMPGDLVVTMEVRLLRELIERGIPSHAVGLLGRWASPQRLHIADPHRRSDEYLKTCFTLIHSAAEGLADDLALAGSPCMKAGPGRA